MKGKGAQAQAKRCRGTPSCMHSSEGERACSGSTVALRGHFSPWLLNRYIVSALGLVTLNSGLIFKIQDGNSRLQMSTVNAQMCGNEQVNPDRSRIGCRQCPRRESCSRGRNTSRHPGINPTVDLRFAMRSILDQWRTFPKSPCEVLLLAACVSWGFEVVYRVHLPATTWEEST